MRKSLFSAAAVAPLSLLVAHGAASAQTTPVSITGNLTAPIFTADYNDGVPSDLLLASGAEINLKSGIAVTVNSSNTFENDGTINVEADSGTDNSGNATGILVLGGTTGGIDNKGTINATETYTATDSNNDGVLDGAWAQGSGRYGIRVIGPGSFTGDITNEGTINIQGNSSFGISVETQMLGTLLQSGTINVTGDNSTALAESGGVSGDVKVTGSMTVNGQGSKGVDLSGNVGGAFSVYNSITVTGFRLTTRPQDPTFISKMDPTDFQIGGPAVDVRASVAKGIFIGAPPAGTDVTNTTIDADGDGIPDYIEGTANISSYGSAPALKIGDVGKTIDIGEFGTGPNAFGLIVRGNITADGVYDGFAANAIQIGAPGGTTTIEGGVRNVGVITTQAYQADAVGIHQLAGAEVDQYQMEGTLNTTAVSTTTGNQSTAVLIDAGATANRFYNIGTITTVAGGDAISAYSVQDLSGTLHDVINEGTISSKVDPTIPGDSVTGRTVAFDLSHNTSGITFVQDQNPDTPGALPLIVGDILLGTGDDTVEFLAGSVTGALDFNAGGGSLLIDNGAIYSGALTASGTLSSVNVNNGSLTDLSPTAIHTGSLNVGATSTLVFTADPTHGTSTDFVVSGTANIASGAKLGLNLVSLPTGTQTFTVVNAGKLTVGAADTTLLTQVPFLVIADAHTDTANNTLDIDVRRRTAQELGLNRSETAAYDSVYSDLAVDSGIQRAFLAQQTQSGLIGIYDQMLPDHAGGVLRTIQWAAESAQDAAAHAPEQVGVNVGPTRGWTEEIAFSESKDRGDASAYRILGFGIAAGVESVSARGDALGVDMSFVTGDISNPDTPGDDRVGVQQFGVGAYWRGTFGHLHVDAQGGGGFMWANGQREFIFADSVGVVHRLSTSNWDGYSVYGRLGAYYDLDFGSFYARPGVHADYIRLHESGYTESGGGDGFDLAVDSRTGDALSVTASMIFGYTFGDEIKWRPEVEVGYRGNVAGSGGDTTAAFTGGGSPFTLPAEALRGGGPIARFGIHAYGQFVDLKIDAGGQFYSGYTDIDLRLMVRIVF